MTPIFSSCLKGLGQIKINSPKIGSSPVITSIAAREFRELNMYIGYVTKLISLESYRIFNDNNLLRLFI